MFVAKILYFNFLAKKTILATLLDHIFLEEKYWKPDYDN